jgi:hypothetical protein
MRFDWRLFCKQRGVHFDEAGARVSKGNINIRCPFCGGADKSGHMGLSLDVRAPVWGCLRNAKHRGRDPARLIAAMLRVPFHVAQAMVEVTAPLADDFEAAVDALRNPEQQTKKAKPMEAFKLPEELRPIDDLALVYRDKFVRYMKSRWFPPSVVRDYELLGSLSGKYAWRVCFPIYNGLGQLIGLTGREIRKGGNMPYLTSEDLPKEAILDFPKQVNQTGFDTLVCEGPMDALKLDVFGFRFGIRAVATMGTGQADPGKARVLRARYGRLAVVFDADATAQGLQFAEELGARAYFLPPGFKDPGALTPEAAENFLRKIG